jgi:hypothetical protein
LALIRGRKDSLEICRDTASVPLIVIDLVYHDELRVDGESLNGWMRELAKLKL